MHPRVFGIACLCFAIVARSHGCSGFVPVQPPLKELAKADAVFTGKVTDIEQKEVPFRDGYKEMVAMVTVKVLKNLKGSSGEATVVYTGVGGGDCGYGFEKGKEYLIYAKKGADGVLHTDITTRTRPLEKAGNEVLELEGKLPKSDAPAKDPTLQFKGTIHEGGYDGYLFTMQNRLWERIFYFNINCPGFLIQVRKDGKWVDYLPAVSGEGRDAYNALKADEFATYLPWAGRQTIFIGLEDMNVVWRAGFQYVTERELDAGGRIQNSKHYVWSDPIDPKSSAKSFTFQQAFPLDDGYK